MVKQPEACIKAAPWDGTIEVTGTITAHFEDPALYEAYRQGQADLADFLMGLIEAKDEEITCARCEEERRMRHLAHSNTCPYCEAAKLELSGGQL